MFSRRSPKIPTRSPTCPLCPCLPWWAAPTWANQLSSTAFSGVARPWSKTLPASLVIALPTSRSGTPATSRSWTPAGGSPTRRALMRRWPHRLRWPSTWPTPCSLLWTQTWVPPPPTSTWCACCAKPRFPFTWWPTRSTTRARNPMPQPCGRWVSASRIPSLPYTGVALPTCSTWLSASSPPSRPLLNRRWADPAAWQSSVVPT